MRFCLIVNLIDYFQVVVGKRERPVKGEGRRPRLTRRRRPTPRRRRRRRRRRTRRRRKGSRRRRRRKKRKTRKN